MVNNANQILLCLIGGSRIPKQIQCMALRLGEKGLTEIISRGLAGGPPSAMIPSHLPLASKDLHQCPGHTLPPGARRGVAGAGKTLGRLPGKAQEHDQPARP